MNKAKRKSISDDLDKYDLFAKKDDYIEVTEWTNGEGFDVDINGKERVSLTYGEFDAVKKLLKELYK